MSIEGVRVVRGYGPYRGAEPNRTPNPVRPNPNRTRTEPRNQSGCMVLRGSGASRCVIGANVVMGCIWTIGDAAKPINAETSSAFAWRSVLKTLRVFSDDPLCPQSYPRKPTVPLRFLASSVLAGGRGGGGRHPLMAVGIGSETRLGSGQSRRPPDFNSPRAVRQRDIACPSSCLVYAPSCRALRVLKI